MGYMLDYLLVSSYKATPVQRLIQCFRVYRSIFVPNLDWPSWTRVKGRLTKASDQPDQRVDKRNMDSQVVTVDQFHGHGFVSGGYSWPRPENKWVEGLALG